MKYNKKKSPNDVYSRRRFMRYMLYGVGAAAFSGSIIPSIAFGNPFIPSPEALARIQKNGKLGIALVGLGNYSTGQLAPALQDTALCKLTGIVTGSPEKIPEWKRKYGIKDANVYNYENFEDIANNDDIDIIYIVLPNGMHAEYTIKAARTGKHIICEKPMATSAADAEAMIRACEDAGVMLSIGYRLHFEPHHKHMRELGQSEKFGPIDSLKAGFGFNIGAGGWRLDKELAGGGPLQDLGIYCVQGVVYTKGDVPLAITAQYEPVTDEEKFSEVEEGIRWQMFFKDGTIADCVTSYKESYNQLRVETEKSWFELSPAYSYRGIRGKTGEGGMDFKQVNQQALQMDAFADCVINKKKTTVPGEMGLRDVALIAAIYEAADTGRRVEIPEAIQKLKPGSFGN